MTGRLAGKTVLVTGAAQGQGAAEARLFSAEGASVVLTDVKTDEGQAVAGEIGAEFLAHDVSSAADWSSVAAHIEATHGQLDGLVNNAAIFERSRLVDTTEDQLRRMLDINVMSVYFGMKAAVPLMSERGGSIVNISSVAGIRGAPGSFAYGASKFAVTGMTKTAAFELGEMGIRVNSIHPGFIDTSMLPDNQTLRDNMAGIVPLGRVADAQEVARLALYLVSDESSYSTGSEFVVDGGISST